MKNLASLAIISMVAPLLAACGPTDEKELDVRILSDGDNNKVATGGYWWAYADRSGTSSITPNTGKDAAGTPKPGIGPGNGVDVDADPLHKNVIHAVGSVGPAPHWTDTLGTALQADGTDWRDVYWDQFYGADPAVCLGGFCGEVMYPAAGIGFGFQADNVPIDLSMYAGIAFDIKAGQGHGGMPAAPNVVYFSVPMDLTDAPDPGWNDKFTRSCTFPQTPDATDPTKPRGPANKSCFGNYAVNLPITGNWQRFCVLWTQLGKPGWAAGALDAEGITFQPNHVIKAQWDAYKPPESDTVPSPFDYYIDNVRLLDATNQPTECAAAIAALPPT